MGIPILKSDYAEADAMLGGCMCSVRHQIAMAIATERERCAQIAEHLNGWGNKATRASGLAEHIAKVIRGI